MSAIKSSGMQQFLYEVRDDHGELSTGTIAAPSFEEAGRILTNRNQFVVRLSPAAGGAARRSAGRRSGAGIKRRDPILFGNQMAVMLDTGVPLGDALQGITRRSMNPRFKTVLHTITEDVKAGTPFSEALKKFPAVFPPIMTAMLRAGEASGTLSDMLGRAVRYLTKDNQTVKQIRGILMYPAFMLITCVSVTTFLLTVVLPRFALIYEKKGAVLPGPTRFLMAVSNGLVSHWYLWFGGAALLIAALVAWCRTASGRRQIDWLKLHTPILSGLFNRMYMTRGCRTLGTMIDSGVSLLESVTIVREVTRNTYYDRMWDRVDGDLRRGREMSDALASSPLMPNEVIQMVQSGEKAGRLGEVFERVAEFTEAEFDQAIKDFTPLIEPLMIVVMAAVGGFVAIAMLMPIFSVGRVVASG